MFVLLPPSEGKSNATGHGCFAESEPDLKSDAEKVIRHVGRLTAPARGKFYGIKDSAKLQAIHAANKAALKAGCIKALERYTGVVYQHLDCPSLTRPKDAEKRVLIVSGYFGLITGRTMLPHYKMPMNPWLVSYWLPINTKRLNDLTGRKPVLSLLPQAYAKAVNCEKVFVVEFRVEGGRKPAGHFGKAIKGRFVRWLIENRVASPRDFSDFSDEGFEFDGTNFVQH